MVSVGAVITLPELEMGETIEPTTEWPRLCFEEVEIAGYSGLPSEVELVTYIIENVVSLEKTIIHPCSQQVILLSRDQDPLNFTQDT